MLAVHDSDSLTGAWRTWLSRAVKQLANRRGKAARLEAELRETRRRLALAELRPHLLFNTLNMISTLIYDDPVRADAALVALSDLLRGSLRSSRDELVRLAEEVELSAKYLSIVEARYGSRIEFRLDIDPGSRDAMVPVLILQPVLENAVLHGGVRHGCDGRIEILSRRYNGSVRLEIHNTAPGGPREPAPVRGFGIGLSNVRQRLEALFGDRSEVRLAERVGGGAVATIVIPYRPLSQAPESETEVASRVDPDRNRRRRAASA